MKTLADILEPLHDVVVLDPEEEIDTRTKGGIIIPAAAAERQVVIKFAKVVTCGPGRQVEPSHDPEAYTGRLQMGVRPGQRVIYHTRACHEFMYDGHVYLLAPITEVLAIINSSGATNAD